MADVCIPSNFGGTEVGELVLPTYMKSKTYTMKGKAILLSMFSTMVTIVKKGDIEKKTGLNGYSDGNLTVTYDGTTLTIKDPGDFIDGETVTYVLLR